MLMHWISPFHRCLAVWVIGIFCATPPFAHCAEDPSHPLDLSDLDLEGLGNLQVTSASRKAQRFKDTAAAIFVITNEDIRRSGATSIPDALRMVPGVQVARIGNDQWAVSARGFNGQYSNKLLVQIDGRSVYSPLYSGVYWLAQDMALEDIERIEVIRGPGAALWGANAVNGIINIITKKTQDTLGNLVQADIGTQEKGTATLRHGAQSGDDTQYRLYAKAYARSESEYASGAGAGDASRSQHAGFRLDHRLTAGNRLMVSGDVYEAHTYQNFTLPSLLAPYSTVSRLPQNNRGIHMLTRYDHTLQDGSAATLQAYVESTALLNASVTEQRDTYDLDFQHRLLLGSRHDFIWGFNYRLSRDTITTPEAYVEILPKQEDFQIASAFVHDEMTLVPERLRLISGIKLEHNSYTGLEPQPNLRLLWTPDSSQTVWTAWSRAVRTPSRASRNTELDTHVTPPFTGSNQTALPVLLRLSSIGVDVSSEKLTALEIGYRAQIGPRLAVDLTAFVNHYTELAGVTAQAAQFQTSPVNYLLVRALVDNDLSGYSRGLEASLDWRPMERWRLQASYTRLRMDFPTSSADALRNAAVQNLIDQSPAHQLSLRSMFDLAPGRQLDLWLRHVARVPFGDIPAYTTLDVRYGWQPKKGLDLSIIGQNLFASKHPEFLPDGTATQALQVQPSVYLRATWKY